MLTEAYQTVVLKSHSSIARCVRHGALSTITYSGPIGRSGFLALGERVIRSTSGSSCLLVRMDVALLTMLDMPTIELGVFDGDVPPGAIIARADQYDLLADYAERMALAGVRRVVFLDSQMALCRMWVDWQLAEAPAELPQDRRYRQPLFEAHRLGSC